KTPPASVLLKQAAKIAKGAGDPKREKVGRITRKQLKENAEIKYKDLNAVDMEGALNIIGGTARSMGIEIID
ncbi:MAG: 50S ribosomal protein L11, partial [Syntrophales bacterium]|nr:50S ribosomal protein L11 [Syntrophales bacterium]